MTRPHHYLMRMLLFLSAVGVVWFLLFIPFSDAFMANPALNGLIVGVLFIGILYNFRQAIRLYPEVTWIVNFRDSITNSEARARYAQSAMPKLLAPMATMVGDRDQFALSTTAMRTLLDGIVSRLDESRDTSRYTIGLLIFLGLLGTFWGLLGTVSSISDVIGTLSVNGGDAGAIFGLGFPPYTGGPFRYVDTVGASTILRRLEELHSKHGTRFTPAQLLQDQAKSGKKFYN